MEKMRNQCIEANIPVPTFSVKGNDFWIVFRKDIYFLEYLKDLGLSERQVKAVLYAKKNGRITNREYQTLNDCSRATANRDLTELVQKGILLFNEIAGAGANYLLK
jgi:ATP-dependent DNA helicase RecG